VFLLIFVPIALILFIAGWTTGGKEGSRFLLLGIVYLLMPLIYLPLMYIFIRLYCWLYNKVAARFGGIRFTLTDLCRTAAAPTGGQRSFPVPSVPGIKGFFKQSKGR
jgi:hypothetical protein